VDECKPLDGGLVGSGVTAKLFRDRKAGPRTSSYYQHSWYSWHCWHSWHEISVPSPAQLECIPSYSI
jgi:hypothetical protein